MLSQSPFSSIKEVCTVATYPNGVISWADKQNHVDSIDVAHQAEHHGELREHIYFRFISVIPSHHLVQYGRTQQQNSFISATMITPLTTTPMAISFQNLSQHRHPRLHQQDLWGNGRQMRVIFMFVMLQIHGKELQLQHGN